VKCHVGDDVIEVNSRQVSVAVVEESLAEIGGRLIFSVDQEPYGDARPGVTACYVPPWPPALEDKGHEGLQTR
jgi:hypothetical protein